MIKIEDIILSIKGWLKEKWIEVNCNGFVIGISGGIDSAVTSTLCAETGIPTYTLVLPINQSSSQIDLATEHINWLQERYSNVNATVFEMSHIYNCYIDTLTNKSHQFSPNGLAKANLKSRLRMTLLYVVANTNNLLVVGTGNKIEDYGVGFFTKYGDGGVDISPIGDLYKSTVYEIGKYFGVSQSIIDVAPIDGLWEDKRTDEDQLGITYKDLEETMKLYEQIGDCPDLVKRYITGEKISKWNRYLELHKRNLHKINMPPICKLWQQYER